MKIHKTNRMRPKAKITYKNSDLILELFGFLLLSAFWIYIMKIYPNLPETFPSHINISGKIDDYSNKSSIWSLLTISTIIYIGMSIISLFPRYFNYMVEITQDNAETEYPKAVNMVRYLKIITLIIFLTLTAVLVKNAVDRSTSNFLWLLVLISIALFLPTIYYLYTKKNNPKRY